MMTITYEYETGLYVNLTNRCDCACVFCLRHNGHGGSIYADDLWLDHEPTREEALESLLGRELPSYSEIVFCGFGEPTYRFGDICWLIDQMKARVQNLPPIRINTNGHANLLHGLDLTPALHGRVDTVSISLNGSSEAEYVAVTKPQSGAAGWEAMLEFARLAAKQAPHVVFTVVDKDKTAAELEHCRALAESLGATLRIRAYIPD